MINNNYTYNYTPIAFIIGLIIGTLGSFGGTYFIKKYYYKKNYTSSYHQEKSYDLKAAMRVLWTDHVVWTRDYVIAAVAKAPDATAASKRLLKNQEDIGNAIVSFYGKQAGDELTKLLKEHILIAVDLITAAQAGDKKKYEDIDTKWKKNAEEIATFLNGANPYLTKDGLNHMLSQHLAFTTDEVVARLNKKWDDDVIAFDKIFTEILAMADELSEGIIKQFPEKFK